MADNPNDPSVTFIDNPLAPDIFADDFTGVFVLNGNLRITLHSSRVSHTSTPGPISNVVIGRLVMPVDAAESMARQILSFLEGQRSNPAPSPQGSSKAH